MRILVFVLASVVGTAHADWRARFMALAERGEIAAAVELAERERMPWFAPHLVRHLPPPAHYIGWVDDGTTLSAYRVNAPQIRTIADREDPLAGIDDWLTEADRWVFAPDGVIESLPLAVDTGKRLVYAFNRRSAALAAQRVRRARQRPPSLFAYARAAPGDPAALPAAPAEIVLAARALGVPGILLAGRGALDELRVAAYDGRLQHARFVLFATHARATSDDTGGVALELAPGPDARFLASDTVHLQFNAELVVLSACESGSGAAFAHAAHLAGVGQTLLTQWPVDDAAAAQFVGALFTELGAGAPASVALARTQRAFADGEHGATYRHPFFWAGWQLWGG